MKIIRILVAWMILLILPVPMRSGEIQIPRLSPLPVDLKSQMICLNGEWGFNPAPGKEFWQNPDPASLQSIEVPGEWVMQGFEVKKGEKAGYCRTFHISREWKGKRIKLRCNAIYSDAVIYINGKEAGSHMGGFTPFELDITSYVRWEQENQITIAVTNEGAADSLSNASRYAAHPLGGITRDIYLFALAESNLSLFHISTEFDEQYRNAILKTEIEVTHEARVTSKNLRLIFHLYDADGKEIKLRNHSLDIGKMNAGNKWSGTIEFDVQQPEPWTSEHPYLYTFTCELREGNQPAHITQRMVGFRDIRVKGNQVFVNNKPIKLRGVCRHEVMPLRGRSLIGNIWEEDVKLFREANVNYIRTSHYPPDEALLEACDRLGMFVELEAPFCWAHEASVAETDHYRLLVNQHIEMVNRDRSHPSVIMWSLGNESNKYEEYFKEAGEVIKRIDPTRPRIFSQWVPDADHGELEIMNHHYPGPNGPDIYRNSNRPVIFDEFCHLNSYNRFELAADPGIRNMWGVLLDRMWEDMYYSQGVLGGALWAGIDDTFFLPDGGAVGYGTWGPIDGWRRPKPEYWNVKKAFSPVRIRQKGNMNSQGKILFDVENRHNFINLAECTFEWQAGKNKGGVRVDLEAGERGCFTIILPPAARQQNELSITVNSPLGYILDEYNFRILPEKKRIAPPVKKGEISVQETTAGLTVKTIQNRIELNLSTGLISVYDTRDNLMISSSPVLMILPLNSEGRGIQMTGNDMNFEPYTPVCTDWVCHSIEWEKKEEHTEIIVKGHYKEAQGSFIYKIQNNGLLSVCYNFTLLRDINPRQTGIVFGLPESFNHLSWERKGYWNVYPENHLGSLTGNTKAFDETIPVSGSAGPRDRPYREWSFDRNSAGSNLFRATKENIYHAELVSTVGGSVEVLSDGEQHLRSWIDTENMEIKMLVADYNNAGREGFLASHAEKDYKPLKKGNKIKGEVTLRMK